MTPEMEFESIIVSSDPGLTWTITEVLRNLSIMVDHCHDSAKAGEIIGNRSHELVVIDWDGEASVRLLHTIWNLPKRRTPTILAVSDNGHHAGAHFTLRKPATPDSATEALKAVYPRMLLDYRLNARFALMTRSTAQDDNGRSIRLTVTDIGEGGLGLCTKETLNVGDPLSLALLLPDAPRPIHIRAQIIWTRDYGAAGGNFLGMPPADRDILRSWLRAKAQVKKPLITI